eukprot:TRINITY_DN28176_c0_g1_i1.p1 TRINITY_DN28176_c0_g1~~TRINITY_DN28176_c0_g1_i1.p1  ORF type:complete len:202 (+),score=32.24 TRINITY_DN28176_c0_g1_i1:91-606(+)
MIHFNLVHIRREGYKQWRDTVAPMMKQNRTATQWDTVWPTKAESYRPEALILERPVPEYYYIEHKYVEVGKESIEPFKIISTDYAKEAARSFGAFRVDFLQSVDNPRKFLFIEVFRFEEYVEVEHLNAKHFIRWREISRPMISKPPFTEKYVNLFPTIGAGWQIDRYSPDL